MPKVARGKFDDAECIGWYVDFKMKSVEAPSASADVNTARKRLYDAQVVKTELDIATTKRMSIPADEHLIDMNQLAVMFVSGLDALVARVASEVPYPVTGPAMLQDQLLKETNAIRADVANAITTYASTVSA